MKMKIGVWSDAIISTGQSFDSPPPRLAELFQEGVTHAAPALVYKSAVSKAVTVNRPLKCSICQEAHLVQVLQGAAPAQEEIQRDTT